jgi:hypothetical protein
MKCISRYDSCNPKITDWIGLTLFLTNNIGISDFGAATIIETTLKIVFIHA